MNNFKRMITVLTFCVCAVSVMAQTYELSGTVKDDLGEYLPGVNIVIKGTTNGTLSDMQGGFSINVQEGDVIEASFIGMEKQEIAVIGQKNIDIVLTTDAKLMSEVMVVAYGTTTKEAFTGSATVINSETMTKQPVANITQALQGKAASVRVSNNSGQPGTAGAVRVRGIGSMGAGSSPLYVVDGVATSTSVSAINPADIESITVLKDASATSLYGSRAANGVIIVTTKIGKSKEGQIRFSSKTGVSQRIGDGYEIMDAAQYYQHTREGLYNEAIFVKEYGEVAANKHADDNMLKIVGFNPYNTSPKNTFNDDGTIASGATLLYDEDWRDALYCTGITQDYSLSSSGSSDDGSYFVSIGYYDQTGIVIGTDYSRYSVKANFTKDVKEWLKIGSLNNISYSEMNSVPTGAYASNPVRAVELINPASPIKDADGSYNWDNLTSRDFNPIGLRDLDIYNSDMMTLSSSLNAEISLPFDIKYTSTGLFEYTANSNTTYKNPAHGDGAAVTGRSAKGRTGYYVGSITNLLSWSKSKDDNSISAILGQESRYEKYDGLSAEATNGLVPGNPNLNGFSRPLYPSSSVSEWGMISYFGRVDYNKQGKYYLSGSLRNDFSSRFGDKKSWGLFYSLGGAWRISEESSFDVSWIDNLKLRASVGTSGNNDIGNYAWQGLYALGSNYNGASGSSPSQLVNGTLTWESTLKNNIAVETSLFNRLDIVAEAYYSISDQLLIEQPYAPSRGYTSSMSNLGAMSNLGYELTANYLAVTNDEFDWNVTFNISGFKNEILNLTQNEVFQGTKRWVEGSDIYQYYLKDWAGVDPMTGKPMWFTNASSIDIDGDIEPTSSYLDEKSGRMVTNNYSDAERVELGSASPKIMGSLGNSLTYKNFAFNFNFYYSLGGLIYNSEYSTSMHDGTAAASNLSVDALDAWTTPGQETNVPRYIANNTDQGNAQSSRYLEDGSYLRLSNVSLSYNLPKRILDKSILSSVQIYVSADNLWTLTSYKGYDPEVGLSGVSNYNIPGTKTTVLGLNVSF